MPFDTGYKRLGIIIVLALTLTIIYTSEAVLLYHSLTPSENIEIDTDTNTDIYINETTAGEQALTTGGSDTLGILLDIFFFLTFMNPNYSPIMIAIMTPCVTILNIVFIYLVTDLIIAIYKGVSPFAS